MTTDKTSTVSMPRRHKPQVQPGEEPFGTRLARLRKARGLTQVQLAERVGISQPLLSYYEHESQSVPPGLLARFADALEATLEELVLGTKRRQPTVPQRVRHSRLAKRLHELESLPEADQKAILRILESLLAQHRKRSA